MEDDPNARWRRIVSAPVDLEPFDAGARAELEIAAVSACGRLRPHNTDHYLAIRLGRTQETLLTSLAEGDLPDRFEEFGYAMIVADGLGDRGAGARASRVALSALALLSIQYGKWRLRVDQEAIIKDITEQAEFLYHRMHDAVVADSRAEPDLAQMSASLTGMYVAGRDLFFAHVGHTRGFLFREGELIRLTTDHTVGEQQTDVPFSYAKTDFTHLVTESIGGWGEPNVDIEHVTVGDGDRLLLCTNGLTDAVSDNDIASVLALQRRPADDCQRLLELAVAARGADDVTVMVANCRLRPGGGVRG